jgi:aryl-alcohol dehydrogenase-like predicted oxidoreductase
VHAQGEDVVPIPGTKHPERLEENAGALAVTLTIADLARIGEVAPRAAFAGDRYADMRFVHGLTPTRLEV